MAKSPVYERLRTLRQAEQQALPRFTMTWLANKLGVDRTAIYRWLNGTPGWEMPEKRRRQIAALLDMPVEEVRPGDSQQLQSEVKVA